MKTNLQKAILKIKRGNVKSPIVYNEINTDVFTGENREALSDPEMAYDIGFDIAVLHCGELLAKAEYDDIHGKDGE